MIFENDQDNRGAGNNRSNIRNRALANVHYVSLAGFVIALGFTIWLLVREGTPSGTAILGAIIGLFVSLIVDWVSTRFSHRYDKELQQEKLDELHETAKSKIDHLSAQVQQLDVKWSKQFSVSHVDTTKTATKKVSDQIIDWAQTSPGGIEIKNTFVLVRNFTHEEDDEFQQMLKAYEAVLSRNGNYWWDAISINELFSVRYDAIFKDRLSLPRLGVHKVGVVRHILPLINYIIICDKTRKRSAAYFGWVYDHGDSDSEVFYTEDQKLIALLQCHFQVLSNNKIVDDKFISIDYSKQGRARLRKSTVVDRQGWWLTFAYPPGTRSLESVGLVKFVFIAGKLEVSGWTLNASVKKTISAEDPQHTTRRIYFDYKTKGSDGLDRDGYCMYRFEKKLNSEEYLRGFFTNDRDLRKVDFIGVRVGEASALHGASTLADLSERDLQKAGDLLFEVSKSQGINFDRNDVFQKFSLSTFFH